MKIEKKTLMLAAAVGSAGVAAGLLCSHYERGHFVVEETQVISEKIRHPYTLVFLADLHDKEFGPGNERLLHAIKKVKPDAVLIGGDTMVARPDLAGLEVTGRLLEGLSSLCPVYYGNGNHEQRLWQKQEDYGTLYRDFRRLLHKYGVVYLSDASVRHDADVQISGLNIDRRFYNKFMPPHMSLHYMVSHLGAADTDAFQILLAHSPLFFDTYAAWGADLTLAGHFHGGTIRLPALGGVMTPQYQFFSPYCAGTFEEDGRVMIVSRGLGTHTVNIRFQNRPQVVLVKLAPRCTDKGDRG